jgi:hypothetical protein
LFVKFTVTGEFAVTLIDWRSKARLVATTARVTGAPALAGGDVGLGTAVAAATAGVA